MNKPQNDSQPADLPRCTDCIHYYITHEARFRYGCQRLGFKSAHPPSRVVFQASGQPCLNFVRKPGRAGSSHG